MSIKYELSLWRDYPGSEGIREEKISILAATGMDFAGRAQNIKLKKEYTGKLTLEFEIPVKYFDPLTGETIKNPLCNQIFEKSKIKLWRDELWWNPFGGDNTYDNETECTKYTGAWEQGHWYDLVVDSHKEKRSKKQLFYSYTCNALFVSELSRNGYGLQFVPNTDVMSSNGMGTAHDLAERIVEGTDWEYVKTEVFPDYKEEFNAMTGETVKTPVSTDQVEFSKGLERYCYCYEVEVSDDDEQINIKNSIKEQLINQEVNNDKSEIIKENVHYGFTTNNKFWWKGVNDKSEKKYVLSHIKTDISFNGADAIFCVDSGEMKYYTDLTSSLESDESKPTGVTGLSEAANLWTAVSGSMTYRRENIGTTDIKFRSYLTLTGKAEIVYSQGASKPLAQGKLICVKVDCTEETNIQFSISDGAVKTDENGNKLYAFTKEIDGRHNSVNAYDNTYWITIPKHISQPYFYIKNLSDTNRDIRAIYIYEFKGATKDIDNIIREERANSTKTFGLISDLLSSNFPSTDVMRNVTKDENNNYVPIWLGFGKTTVEGYQKETYTYLVDYEVGGKYHQIYLPINNNKNVILTKISSYNTDKRRQIKGERSNRFTLIETISKTFNCFTRFIVEHDLQGRIKTENGKPVKKFTFVSELGRKNFHGFNYGVNLDTIERTVDANNLVTKCHVSSVSNQYTDSNMVTIQDSKYNKLGMTYIYNFSYYLRRGLLDRTKFLKDYQKLVDNVGRLVQANKTKMERDGGVVTRKTNLETDISTYEIMLEAYKSNVAESLATIGWDRFINGEKDFFSGHGNEGYEKYTLFPDIRIDFLKQYKTKDITIQYYYYEDDTVKGPSTFIAQGKYKVPNRFEDLDTLAQYMAYNTIGSVNNGGVPGSYDKDKKYTRNAPSTDSEFWGKGLPKDTIYNELNRIFSSQSDYKTTQIRLDQAKKQLEDVTKQYDAYNAALEANNKEIKHLTANFERKYADYIIEGEWKGDDYIDADAYYLDATRAMSVSCMPKVSYSIGAMDLSQLANPFDPTEEDWGKEFTYNVGDTTYIKDEELFGNMEQLAMIASITTNVDVDKQDEIELRNYETRFEELFQQIAAVVTAVQFNENIWSKADNFMADGTIDESILQASFANNKNLVIASANNTVTQDNRGITVRDNDTGKIVRLIGGGLFLSHDGGNTYKAGITPDGINATLITTGQLDTSKIVIRSTDTPSFELSSQGLTAYGTVDSRITRFDQFGVYSSDKAESFTKDWWKGQNNPDDYIVQNSSFSVTKAGFNLNFADGNSSLTLGIIGKDSNNKPNKWGLRAIKNGVTTVEINHNGEAKFTGEIIATSLTVDDKPFSDAVNEVVDIPDIPEIDVSGFIKESDFNIKTETDSDGNTKTTVKVKDQIISETYDDGDYILTNVGLGTTSGKYVKLDKDGTFTTHNAVVHGTIYANSGKIAGLTSKNKRLYGIYEWPNEAGTTYTSYISGMNTSYSNALGDIHFLFCGVSRVQNSSDGAINRQWATDYFGNANWGTANGPKDYINNNAKFYVTHYGYLHAEDAYIRGDITATSLTLTSNASVNGLSYNSLSDKPTIPTSVTQLAGSSNIVYKGDITTTTGTDSNGNTYTRHTVPTATGNVTYTTYESDKYMLFGRTAGTNSEGNYYTCVEKSGLLTARNAWIQGTIFATRGEIGCWNIEDYHLYGYNSTDSIGSGLMMNYSYGKNAPAFYAGYSKKNPNGYLVAGARDYPWGADGWAGDGTGRTLYGPKDYSWFSYGAVKVEISQKGYFACGDAVRDQYLCYNPTYGILDFKGTLRAGTIMVSNYVGISDASGTSIEINPSATIEITQGCKMYASLNNIGYSAIYVGTGYTTGAGFDEGKTEGPLVVIVTRKGGNQRVAGTINGIGIGNFNQ